MKSPLVPLLLMIQTHKVFMNRIEKNSDCSWRCSEGLKCKPRTYSPLSVSHCKQKPAGSAAFFNVTPSTILTCEGGKCSLQVQIATSLNITGDIRGVSMCADSAGMIGQCQIYNFGHAARENLRVKQAEVQFKCVPVRPGQHLFITLKTVPNYCKAAVMQRYVVPDCNHEDIRNDIPECITGKLDYIVDKDRREITVRVTDAPADAAYNLRLCHKRSVVCTGAGTHKTIKQKDLQRSVSFHYSKALPCLCIEGWPARVDARRVQACPFKNDLEELWSGMTYDPFKEELIWEPMCPTKTSVSLCHADGENGCRDLGNVFYSEGQKVIFSSVDPHPALCTKFTTDVGTWIKCPFSKGNFTVWSVKMTSQHGKHWVEISSWVKANFSVFPCLMQHSQCAPMERNATQTIFVDKMKRTAFNLSRTACKVCVCIQVQRVDVTFSVPVLQCDVQCSNWCRDPERSYHQYFEITVATAVFLTALLAAALIAKVTIKDGGKATTLWTKLRERESDACLYSK